MVNYIIIQTNYYYSNLADQLNFYIAQIILGHYNLYYIEYNEEVYISSVFTLGIKKFIDEYNKDKVKGEYINFIDNYNLYNLDEINLKVVNMINCDLVSYFKKHLFKVRYYIDDYAFMNGYSIKFNPHETIITDSDEAIDIINQIKSKYPNKNFEVKLINPLSSIDLFYMSTCDFVILSKNSMAAPSLFFSRSENIWIPSTEYIRSLGLNENCGSKFNYY